MDPCLDTMVYDCTVGVVEIVVLLETVAHYKNVAQSVLPSTHPASCMNLRLFPSLTPKFYNFYLHVPMNYKSYIKYSLVLSCTSAS
jgi:hypothetical protein